MAAEAALAMVNPGHGELGGGAVLLAAMGRPTCCNSVRPTYVVKISWFYGTVSE